MSLRGEIGRLLRAAADEEAGMEQDLMAGYAFSNLWREMTELAPPQPVCFLSRVTHVFPGERDRPKRVVAGTPLYVGFV
jgi:hypothetical protein